MRKALLTIAALALPWAAQAQVLGGAAWRQALAGEEAVPAAPPTAEGAPAPGAAAEAASDEELKKAQEQLAKLVASINEKIAKESDRERKLELYEWRDRAQAALAAVEKHLASKPGNQEREEKVERAIAEAKFLNRMLATYLGSKEFHGYELRKQAFELEVGADAIYAEISRRVPFLRGAVRGRVRINPGAEMVTQFNTLKTEYYAALLEAKQALVNVGKAPSSDARYKGFVSWGAETKVIYPGQTFGKEILDWDQQGNLRD